MSHHARDPRIRLVIVKTGDSLPAIVERYGDFDRMFTGSLNEVGTDAHVVAPHRGEALPDPGSFDAAIITGSPASVTDREPWADTLADWIRGAVEREKHVLGVCYGHQLLAHALGGVVERNPNGYESGTIDVELTDDGIQDALLGYVARGDRTLPFNSTHADAVVVLPKDARLLASTARTKVQAFAYGDRAWGLQFHPEFSEQVMRMYVEGRADYIAKDAEGRGLDPQAELSRVERSVVATPHGPFLLRRFVQQARGLRVEQVDRA